MIHLNKTCRSGYIYGAIILTIDTRKHTRIQVKASPIEWAACSDY